MRAKRSFMAAMIAGIGLFIVADVGVIGWTTPALAHHHDDATDDNVRASDPDDADTKVEAQDRQPCSERPNPRKCRRRRHKQGGGRGADEDRAGGNGGGNTSDEPPPAAPPPHRAPEEPCIVADLEDLPPYGTYVCDVYRDVTPIFP
jgi:hypothetical protein